MTTLAQINKRNRQLNNETTMTDGDTLSVDRDELLYQVITLISLDQKNGDYGDYFVITGFYDSINSETGKTTKTECQFNMSANTANVLIRYTRLQSACEAGPISGATLVKDSFVVDGKRIEYYVLTNHPGTNTGKMEQLLKKWGYPLCYDMGMCALNAKYAKIQSYKEIVDKTLCLHDVRHSSQEGENHDKEAWFLYFSLPGHLDADDTDIPESMREEKTKDAGLFRVSLAASKSRDQLFNTMTDEDFPVHSCKLTVKKFRLGGEERQFVALVDAVNCDTCVCGHEMPKF